MCVCVCVRECERECIEFVCVCTGISLPAQRMEAHRIIVSNILRRGDDDNTELAAQTQTHTQHWLSLVSDEDRWALPSLSRVCVSVCV